MTVEGEAKVLPVHVIQPNPWNPNRMSDEMFAKELASIKRYGFVDPLIVRHIPETNRWEIVDGEHRLKAAKQLGYMNLPCWDVGEIPEDTARELTIILNETRGEADRERLSTLLQDLLSRRDETNLRDLMPFSRERFDELIATKREIDWQELEKRREALKEQQPNARWVERVFRMPFEAAVVVDAAIDQMREREGVEQPWRALELICADWTSG